MPRFYALLLLLFVTNLSYASSEDVIQGFAKYQAGRVENIVLNEMLSEIRTNRFFIQLFPQTNDAINNYGSESGKRLIPLMQHFVKADIESFDEFSKCMVLSFYKKIESDNIDVISTKSRNHYLDLQVKFINPKYTVSEALEEYCKYKVGTKTISEMLDEVRDKKIHKKLKELVTQLKNEVLNDAGNDKLVRKYNYWKNVYVYAKYLNLENKSDYIKMHHLVLSFDKLGLNDGDIFYDFRELSLFLAQLSDASKAETSDGGAAVEAVITNFVDSKNDSFNIKRTGLGLFSSYCSWKLCKPVFGIGSYFGVGVSTSKYKQSRVYGPVGVEMRLFNYYGHMAYAGFAPLDFGTPISNELSDKEYSASFEDIRSNSIYISYTYKHKPLSVLLSYHPDDTKTSGVKESFTMLSIAFDLPLYFF